MDKIRLIHDFVDGQLDGGQEEELFLHIAQDEGLRQEMKDLIAMRNASSSIKSIFTPAPESTIKVFGALGFAAPVDAVGTLPWYSRYAQGIKAGAASALVVALLMFWAFVPGEQSNTVDTASNSIPVSSSQEIENTDLSSVSSQSDQDAIVPNQSNSSNTTDVVNNNPIVREESNTSFVVSEDIAENDAVESTEETAEPMNVLAVNNSNIQFNDVYNTGFDPEFRFNRGFDLTKETPEYADNSKFSLEVSGSQQNHFSAPAVDPAVLSPYNNYNLSLMYDINDNMSVGVGYRQETFSNTFEGVDELGIKYRYEAQPNYSTFGLMFRYYAGDFSGVRPFGELMVGANSVGMTNAASLGLKYNVFNQFSLVGAVELSNMIYNYQGSLFNSSKYGFRYGLQYNM